ncbi:MAG TPA: hypothetical protein IAA51_02400 [Candidatus Cottocaccamicrobium excrementipullorum]|nr:hypothetical protein [Candidatus Cottocaccamicrobium excrementipullorum]
MGYEELLLEADQQNIIVREKPLEESDGRIKGNRIAIRRGIHTAAKRADVLAEELGHYYTTVGRIVEQDTDQARKQERTARMWAYNKRVGLSGIIQGYRQHCHSRYELAECLGVTEEFLQEAIDCYRQKYGRMVELDGYMIFFEPTLAVMEKI